MGKGRSPVLVSKGDFRPSRCARLFVGGMEQLPVMFYLGSPGEKIFGRSQLTSLSCLVQRSLTIQIPAQRGYKHVHSSVVDPNTLNFNPDPDPDPELWPNLDPYPDLL